MAIEGSSFELGVVSDPRAIRQFLSELEVIPAALKRVSQAINSVDLGDGRKFAGDGRKLAEAFVQAARSEFAGGSFQRAFREAMSGVDLRIPPEAQAHLRADLERINAEIKRVLPQQVQIGVRANTTQNQLDQLLRQNVPQALPPQPTPTPAQMREQARQLRATAQRQASAESVGIPTLAPGPTEPITPFRRFVAGQTQRDQAQGRLEEQADREDEKRTRARLAGAQRLGRLETQARSEDEKRTRLATPSSDDATLARAAETARQRRLQTQRFVEDPSSTDFGRQLKSRLDALPHPQPTVDSLVESARQRQIARDAERELLRSQGKDVRAGLLGFGSGSFLERQASIVSTTASFAAGGMAFQAVMNGITEVVSGTRQFEDALANLSVTFNDSTNNLRGFATEVGAEANAVGLTQAQGVEAASKSVGLFNTGGQSQQDKEDFARIAVGVTGRIAQQGGTQDLSGVETNLAGILRSFQLQNSDLTRVEDSIAVIAKQTGGNQAEILQAASETATLARSAGFDAFQNSAIIANQATTTGQSAGAAAEQLAQVFAQATNTAVQAKFNQIGINTNASLADQLTQLSGKVQSGQVSQAEFGSISALFGRSRSGAAFRNLVEGLPRIDSLADQARNSPGEGQRQFEQIFGSINGEIIKTVGALKNLATELAQSGALDLLAALVVAVHQTANALTEVLHLFNEIPRPLRSAALGLGELALAIKLLGGTAAASRALAFLGGGTGIGQRVLTRVGGAEVAGAVAARTGAGAAGAGSLAVLTNPAFIAAAAAVGAVIAAQKIGDASQAAQRAEGTSGTAAANARTAEELRGAASARRTAAQAEQGRRDAALGIGNIVDFFNGNEAAKTADRDRQLADSLEARAKVIEQQQNTEQSNTASMFGRFNSPDEVTAQLQRLQAEGFTAAQRVASLSDAFDQIASTADKAGVAVIHAGSSGLFGQGIASGLTGAIGSGASLADLRSQAADFHASGNFLTNGLADIGQLFADPLSLGSQRGNALDSQKFRDLATKLQGTDTAKLQTNVSDAIQGVLSARHIDASKGDAVLSQEDIDAIKSAADDKLEEFIKSVIPAGPEFDEIRRIIRNSFKSNLDQQIKTFTSGIGITPDQALNFFNSTAQEANNAFSEESFRNRAGASATRVQTLKGALDKAKDAVAAGGHDEGNKSDNQELLRRLQEAQLQYDQAVADDQKVQLENTQALIRLRESRRGRLDQTGRLADELDAANAAVAAATDPTDKANAQAAANNIKQQQEQHALDTAASVANSKIDPRNNAAVLRQGITNAKKALSDAKAHGDAKAVADATITLNNLLGQQQQLSLDTAASVANSKIDPRNTGALSQQAVTNAQTALNDAKAHGDAKAVADATAALAQANVQNLQTQISIANARRTSKVPVGDDVATATAALANARDDLKGELAGTEAYYNTLAQIKGLEKGVADARLARLNNQRLLRIDLTDPVAQATAARQAAEDALRHAKGPDERDRARIDLRGKQASEEAAKFQQRLSDVQTADELGRISHQQYLSYLQSEHDRLAAVKHRTRQQQDELNQVDLLMKNAANELSGQFNIGDIKLPTIYEVRRAIKAGAGGVLSANNGFAGSANGQVVNDNSQRTLVVQGVSIEEVMRRVTALYGGRPVRSTAGRKI